VHIESNASDGLDPADVEGDGRVDVGKLPRHIDTQLAVAEGCDANENSINEQGRAHVTCNIERELCVCRGFVASVLLLPLQRTLSSSAQML
jgi:hypothetical protein